MEAYKSGWRVRLRLAPFRIEISYKSPLPTAPSLEKQREAEERLNKRWEELEKEAISNIPPVRFVK